MLLDVLVIGVGCKVHCPVDIAIDEEIVTTENKFMIGVLRIIALLYSIANALNSWTRVMFSVERRVSSLALYTTSIGPRIAFVALST